MSDSTRKEEILVSHFCYEFLEFITRICEHARAFELLLLFLLGFDHFQCTLFVEPDRFLRLLHSDEDLMKPGRDQPLPETQRLFIVGFHDQGHLFGDDRVTDPSFRCIDTSHGKID